MTDFLRHYVRRPLLGLIAAMLYGMFRLLPVGVASGMMGGLARAIGPRLGMNKKARRNLERAFPEKSPAEIDAIIRGMWENLGRNAGEFPHVSRIAASKRVTVEGLEHLQQAREDGRGGFLFSAHIANWEVGPNVTGHYGLPLHVVFRDANNPWVRWIYRRRAAVAGGDLIAKGPRGAKRIIELLRKNEHVGLLIDQKMNDGIAVPFFGRDAMTAPAMASVALRYGVPVIPVQQVRESGARFRIIYHPPLALPDTGDRDADIKSLMTATNKAVEDWIRAAPEQWLWLHRRWPD